MPEINSTPPITLEWLVDKTATVYSLPLSYEKLVEAINHPRSSIADIAKVITEDQGLTVRLLKLANSPMFGFFSKIDSVSKAVTIIGIQQLRDLALAVSVMEIFSGIPKELISMKSFWQHSLGCGIIARALAIYRRETNVERFFAAGILHDLGRLVMCTTVPDIMREVFEAGKKEEMLLFRIEDQRLGFTHAEVGAGVLAKWKIPLSIIEPVSCHHSPGGASQYPLETAIIHLSNIICNALEVGFSGEWYVPPINPAAWEKLDIPSATISSIFRQVRPQIEEAFAIFGESAG